MRRTPTRSLTPRRLAKEMAEQVRVLGGGHSAALAAIGRLLVPDDAMLVECVASMPSDARAVWTEALQYSSSFTHDFDRDQLWAEISRQAQPVLPEGYLVELFLRDLDRAQRHRRGVYFTPQPLVHFLIEAVSRLAAEHFPNQPLHVIDPACGYGAFLLHSRDHWSRWSRSEKTRPLVAARHWTGIELCPITWAVAHLLQPRAPALLNINALTAGESLREIILGPPGQALVPVIVGNPPWSNFGRLNRSPWLSKLLADYRTGLAERKANLADDAIKFLRWGQYWIDQAGAGILAFVTPNTWLAGLTHRRMRQSLLASFDQVLIVDLHGEAGGPAGDENVFGVRSGVALVVMLKRGEFSNGVSIGPAASSQYSVLSTQYKQCEVRRIDLVGRREAKVSALIDIKNQSQLCFPAAPDFSLACPSAHFARSPDYASFWSLDRIFRHYISGVQTKDDAVLVAVTREALEAQVRRWLASQPESIEFDRQFVRPYLVAPFDRRWIYYDPRLVGRPRFSVMRHMLRPNVGLVFMRQSTCPGEYDHFLAVDCLVSDRVFYSRHGAPFLAPLWLDKAPTIGRGEEGSGFGVQGSGVESNFADEFTVAAASAVGSDFTADDLFHYLYAVAYSPTYRCTFAEELRRGFPRLPLPVDAASFSRLAGLGGELVALHVGRACPAAPEASLLPAGEGGEEFRLGGYDVLRRWQSPRRRRGWCDDEAELARLAAIGRETRRLMRAIDGTRDVPAISGRREPYPTETGSSA